MKMLEVAKRGPKDQKQLADIFHLAYPVHFENVNSMPTFKNQESSY